ncbi:MAG TPA: BlaI/MecI/CopY family transcriptional regulator [Candidatus Binatus sp.]|jgi:BlaI family penicillinase repressor|nr:BlaI/MecI/CopY family transcriptional regulator [Candidatus Binatus sp.]
MNFAKIPSPRHALLDLAPLELDCLNMLWPMGEGTVREIRDALAPRRPRAYTTIMTIMDRLARKGIVERRKTGRAYIYKPNLTAEDARAHALAQVIDSFFGGSKELVIAHLDERSSNAGTQVVPKANTVPESVAPASASAAAAGAASGGSARPAGNTSLK